MSTRTRNRTVTSGEVSLAVTEAGDPAHPPVVMIHGYPDTATLWQPIIDRLAGSWHAVAYDVRGAGSSSAPRGQAAYALSRLADDFAAVCDAVAPGRPVHLVGHDWGGIQGWEFVTDPRFEGRIASFTAVAAPALGHAMEAARASADPRAVLRSLLTAARSWYVVPLCLPGGPTLAWRVVLTRDRWRRRLTAEGVPVDDEFPAPSLVRDALDGANLYRANIPSRLLRPRPPARAQAPVQLVVPQQDRFIPESYYAAAQQAAPGLVRRDVPGSHWAPRAHPGRLAEWIGEFAAAHEPG